MAKSRGGDAPESGSGRVRADRRTPRTAAAKKSTAAAAAPDPGNAKGPDARRTTAGPKRAKAPKPPAVEGRTVVEIHDARGIRALAHPARMDAIDHLYSGLQMTATELAAKLGVSPSAMSYHLRELAKWGVIERVEGDGADGRERRWRAAGDSLQISGRDPEAGYSAATTAAQSALVRSMMEQLQTSMLDTLTAVERTGDVDDVSVQFSTDLLLITREEFAALARRAAEMTEPYRANRPDAPSDAQRVRWTLIGIPYA